MTNYLELFVGPMYSGKTSVLIQLFKKYTFCNIPVVVINHSTDTRYDNTMLCTHDNVMIPCIQTNNLSDVLENTEYNSNIVDAKVILINEAQFYPDLYDFVIFMLNEYDGKKIYISGLDVDFQRKKFGRILDLIPICDKITKLNSLCSLCKNGEFGIFSLRLSEETQQTLVGSDNYVPVCRSCFDLKSMPMAKGTAYG